MDKTLKNYIAGLNVPWLEDELGKYRIRILGRGETGFYEQGVDGDQVLVFELDPRESCVFSKSLRKWDSGKRVTAEQQQAIVARLLRYLSRDGSSPQVR